MACRRQVNAHIGTVHAKLDQIQRSLLLMHRDRATTDRVYNARLTL